MGNYISCNLSGPGSKHSNSTKVIFPGGDIQQFHEPFKAAELMLEKPNFFLVNSQSLHIGRRFSALSADEDLEMANVYVMFPMKRLNSVVTANDLGVLFFVGNSAAKRAASRKVDDDSREERVVVAPKEDLDDGGDEFSSVPTFVHRLSMCRSKKPLLETIAEEPICSR